MSTRKDHRCKGTTKAGKPCRAAATEGGLCYFHANPDKASELGRIGGRKNRHAAADGNDPLPALETARDVKQFAARVMEEVYSEKLHPRIGSSLGPLISLQLRAIESTDLERRLAELEKSSAEAKAGDTAGASSVPPSDEQPDES